MKALSIRQPWAWAILHGKDIENRTWTTRFRGRFLIHTGIKFDHEGYLWLLKNCELLSIEIPQPTDFQMGGIVGTANIVDCVSYHKSAWFSGPVGFVLEDAQPADFIPWRGQLGFFEAAAEIANNTLKSRPKTGAP